MSDKENPLGEFLRARRALVTPQQAGIPDGGVRRVPGLRRDEVAALAGISADYYLRLERGRQRHPSVQVLRSIGRVLRLDGDHLDHLLALAAEGPRPRRPRVRREVVPASVLSLLDALVQPALIEGRSFEVLAANALVRAVSPGMAAGRNPLRDFFLDPEQRALFPDWDAMAECFVANLRQAVGTDTDDPRFIELIGELSLASEAFRRLWARHEVRGQSGGPVRFRNPEVGELTLNRERLAIDGAPGLHLVIFHPEPGSVDADRLALLASADLPTREPSPDVHDRSRA